MVWPSLLMTAEMPLLDAGQKRLPTFYNQHGDWFGWAGVVLAAVMGARRIFSGDESGVDLASLMSHRRTPQGSKLQ